MADFAAGLFLHSPFPSIAICSCKRITAVNSAATTFFGNDKLQVGFSDLICGRDCQHAPALDDMGLVLQGRSQSWDIVLARVQDESVSAVMAAPGFHREETYVHLTRKVTPGSTIAQAQAQAELLRRDSPIDDSFPEPQKPVTPSTIEEYHAKTLISPFSHLGQQYYILGFHDITRTLVRRQDHDFRDQESLDKWADRCRKAVFDSIPFMGYLIDAKGRYSCLNRLGSSLAGGVTARDVPKDHEESALWMEDFSRKMRYEETPGLIINRTRMPLSNQLFGQINPFTGKKHLAKAWGSPMWDTENGEFLGSCVFSEDLGEFEAIQQAAKLESLKSFETICDTMPHYVWTANADGSGQWFSSQWLAYTGLRPEDCMGIGWQQTIFPADLERFLEVFGKAHEDAVTYEVEVRCRRYDGVYRWMLKKGAPIKDSDGRVLLWVSCTTPRDE